MQALPAAASEQVRKPHCPSRKREGCCCSRFPLSPPSMKRHFYLIAGWASLGLGAIGAFLPLLPTVPFVILAAFCFARSSPRLENWLLTHPHFGHHIVAWREKGAISRKGKIAATAAFAFSIALAAIF